MREGKGRTGDLLMATEIQVRLTPKSSRNEVLGREGEIYRIKVTAPPVDGRANEALVGFLAKKLGVGRGKVQIITGASSRLKRIRIEGLSSAAISDLLGS